MAGAAGLRDWNRQASFFPIGVKVSTVTMRAAS